MSPVILWFRRNLRLHDNLALDAAADADGPVLPVYISDDLDAGGASRWWLHHSLRALDAELREHGTGLVVRSGKPEDLLPELVEASGAEAVYFSRRCEPQARAQESALEKALDGDCELYGFDDGLIRHPDSVMTQSGTPYKVFTPFWKAASAVGEPDQPLAKPTGLETTTAGLSRGISTISSYCPQGLIGRAGCAKPGHQARKARSSASMRPVPSRPTTTRIVTAPISTARLGSPRTCISAN